MAKKTYSGGCHCGAIRFEVALDLADPKRPTTRCNCRFCRINATWVAHAKPEDFKQTKGHESLGDYSSSSYGHHRFCQTCGIRTFTHGDIPEVSGPYVTINVRCLDDREALEGVAVLYQDGAANTWAPIKSLAYHDEFAKP